MTTAENTPLYRNTRDQTGQWDVSRADIRNSSDKANVISSSRHKRSARSCRHNRAACGRRRHADAEWRFLSHAPRGTSTNRQARSSALRLQPISRRVTAIRFRGRRRRQRSAASAVRRSAMSAGRCGLCPSGAQIETCCGLCGGANYAGSRASG